MSADTPARIEDLLAHREWVRSLARALVRDPDAADDLAQDAFAKAVASPPRNRGSIRAWFRAVMTNRARELHRNESRRSALLPDVARSARDASDDAADLAGRADVERRVLEIVLSLDEPFRETVLLRYWKGLEPSRIAAETGVPAATVRTRLHRALGTIRERLDASGGGRATWLAALLPLAGPEPGPATCGSEPRSPVAFRATVGTLVLAAVAVTAAVTIRRQHGGAEPADRDGVAALRQDPEHAATGATHPPRPRASRVASGSSPETPDAARDEASAAGVHEVEGPVLRIRAALADGSDAPAARVRLQGWKSAQVRDLRSGDPLVVRLPADEEPPNHVFAWTDTLCGAASVPEPGEGGVREVAITLAEGRILRGVVVDGRDAPVAGATVVGAGEVEGGAVAAAESVTGPDGSFALPPLPPSHWTSGATLEVRATGFSTSWTGFDEFGGDTNVRISLERGIVVVGRVLDPDGNPVAGVQVDPSSGDTTSTGADGRFRTDHLPQSKFRLSILPDDFAAHVVQFGSAEPGTRDLGDVRLARGVAATIRALHPDGSPAAHAWIGAVDAEAGQYVRQGQADAEGRITFEHLADRAHRFESHANNGPFEGARGSAERTPDGGEIEVRLETGTSVVLEFRNSEGTVPVCPTELSVKLEADGASRGGPGGDEVQTVFSLGGSTSSVRCDAPREGAWTVTVTARGWSPPPPFTVQLSRGEQRLSVRLAPLPPPSGR